MKFLALLSDAYGGRGGIAQFNRDLVGAVSRHPACEEIVVLPRVVVEEPGDIPARVRFVRGSAGGKVLYVANALRTMSRARFDAVICGHVNLLPVAAMAAAIQRAPLVLVLHGIDAWQPPRNPVARRLVRRCSAFVTVSECTKQRFLGWARIDERRGHVIPNCVDTVRFQPGPKRADLVARYRLSDGPLLLTLARLPGADRQKGVDEVLEALGRIIGEIPDARYLIAGDGTDRPRLEQKARALGVADRVIFTGYVPESEKADHYHLADVFVMPSRGEGFGIVYLEAMACGVPVVASRVDGGREAVRDGALGFAVDPGDQDELVDAVRRSLAKPRGVVPRGLDYFSIENFTARWHAVLDELTGARVA